MKIDLIIFDLDDTLIDFASSSVFALEAVCKAHKISEPLENYHSTYAKINSDLWAQLENGEISTDKVRTDRFRLLCEKMNWTADFNQMSEAYLKEVNLNVKLIPYAKEVSEQLSRKYDLGIITNGFTQVQKSRFQNSGLDKYYRFLMTSEEQGYHKPDQRIFIDAINKLPGKEAAKTVVVGDRLESDILGAKKAGLKSVWLNRHKKQNLSTIKPDNEINCLSELLNLMP